VDVQYMHNFTTNTLKAYLSTQPSCLNVLYGHQDSHSYPKASKKTAKGKSMQY